MEFYIQINPVDPKELKEYLDILDSKGLLDVTDVEVKESEKTQKVEESTTEELENWSTQDVPTYFDIRNKMVELNRAGLGDSLIKILKNYGADKVSALDEQYYLEVWNEMEVLERDSRA